MRGIFHVFILCTTLKLVTGQPCNLQVPHTRKPISVFQTGIGVCRHNKDHRTKASFSVTRGRKGTGWKVDSDATLNRLNKTPVTADTPSPSQLSQWSTDTMSHELESAMRDDVVESQVQRSKSSYRFTPLPLSQNRILSSRDGSSPLQCVHDCGRSAKQFVLSDESSRFLAERSTSPMITLPKIPEFRRKRSVTMPASTLANPKFLNRQLEQFQKNSSTYDFGITRLHAFSYFDFVKKYK